MSARERLDEMKKFMKITEGELFPPINFRYVYKDGDGNRLNIGVTYNDTMAFPKVIIWNNSRMRVHPSSIVKVRGGKQEIVELLNNVVLEVIVDENFEPRSDVSSTNVMNAIKRITYTKNIQDVTGQTKVESVDEDNNEPKCPYCDDEPPLDGTACNNCGLQDIGEGEDDDYEDEEDPWKERFSMKYAEKEKFKGKTIIVTDLYDGDVYGLFNKKRFMISSPMDRGYGVGKVSDSEIEVADLDYSLSPKEKAFLRAWHRSMIDESLNETEGDDYFDLEGVWTDKKNRYVVTQNDWDTWTIQPTTKDGKPSRPALEVNKAAVIQLAKVAKKVDEPMFSLESIVESILEEFPGQPKDYETDEVDPYDEADQREMAADMDWDSDISDEIEDEELGLRFD